MRISVFLIDTNRYYHDLLPAYHAFMTDGETLALSAKLAEARATASVLRSHGNQSLWPEEVYQEHQAILAGTISLADADGSALGIKQFVAESVGWELLDALCLRRDLGLRVEQSMSDPDLAELLYSHSSWIEDMFTGVVEPTGPELEIRFGEWSRLFDITEVRQFQVELSTIPAPIGSEVLAGEFLNLCRLVQMASADDKYALLYTVL